MQGETGNCMRGGAVYSIWCLTCREEGKQSVYVGETKRTMFDRGSEHLKAIQERDQESPLVEHHQGEHGDMELRF